MNCLMCDNKAFRVVFGYRQPDKYESFMSIGAVDRCWGECTQCGFKQTSRNYALADLEKIYKVGYRDPKFRGEEIHAHFNRIASLPYDESENLQRVAWVLSNCNPTKMLDIGSGLGVFPIEMFHAGVDVECVEENKLSVWHITTELGLRCHEKLPRGTYDLVTAVHVLEHMKHPDGFIRAIRPLLKKGGKLFVEVPDAEAFDCQGATHDDFNSCHTVAFDVASLYKILTRNGFEVTDVHRAFYESRKLMRVQVLCQKTGL